MKKILILLLSLITSSVFSQLYILNEDFATATGTTPPANWQNNPMIGPAAAKWHFDNPGSCTINYPVTPPFAILDAPSISPDTALEVVSLETPFFDASVGSYTLLFFDHYFFPDSAAKASILAYNGSTWTEVVSYTVSSTVNPVGEVIDLTAICAGKTNAKLRFQWEGHGKGYWAIDNIRIYAPLFLDAGISQIDAPAMPFNSGVQDVKITLKNYGYQTLSNATIKWSVNGVMQLPFSWNGTIPFGSASSSINIGSYDFQPGSANQFKIWSEMPNGNPDPNPYNDSTIRSLGAALCGIYTIGGTNPNFQTINEAVSRMTTVGIGCPVIFKVRNGTYLEQIEINTIPGSTDTNTVTIESESGDSSQVLIFNQGGGIELPTIRLNNVKNLTLKKLSIRRNYNYLGAILIDNNSENIDITHCKLFSTQHSSAIWIRNGSGKISITANFFISEYTYFSVIDVKQSQDIHITGNKFQFQNNIPGGTGPAAIAGSSGINRLWIINNEFHCLGSSAVKLVTGNDSVKVMNNRLFESVISLNSGPGNGFSIIQGNRVVSSLTSGIVITGNNIRLANNYICVSGIIPLSGIESTNCSQSSIVYNSINILNDNENSKCILVNGGTNIGIKNNIFSNPSGGYSAFIINDPLSCSWDYNNYHNLYQKTGHLRDSTYNSFSSWAAAIEGEANGKNCDPFYTSDTILTPHQILLNGQAATITGVAYDIDSTLRSTINPDIGAKEFTSCSVDAGINLVSSPSNIIIPGSQEVRVILQNQGTTLLTSAIINWRINGAIQPSLQWNGSLISGQNIEVVLGNYSFQSGKIYRITAWTNNPNNGLDCDNKNDTVLSPRIFAKLCGTYTIGGPTSDFATFNDAVSVLTMAGITCPVVFKVKNGTYPEQLVFHQIPGSSFSNTVTFESESGDSSQVLLYHQGIDVATLIVDGGKNIIFKKIGIKQLDNYGTFDGGSVLIENYSDNISLINCKIISDHTAVGIWIRNGTRNVRITNTYFDGSFVSQNDIGINIADAIDILISENVFNKYARAIIAESGFPSNLNISKNRIFSCDFEGIYINTLFDSLFITNNVLLESTIKISATGTNIKSLIQGNRIKTSLYSGLIINTKNCLVANNYITIGGPLALRGIEANSCSNTKIAFNTIHLTNSNLNGTCILLNGGNSIEIMNNIFSNPSGGYSAFVTNNPIACQWDYNNYFNDYKRIGSYSDSTYQSLSSWSSAINGESHGLSCNPFFSNDSILLPHQILLNNVGLSDQEVPYDIDSILRNPTHPDIGAKEFSVCQSDAGINAVSAPVTPIEPGIIDIKVILQNQGTTSLTSATINWSINGSIQSAVSWSGMLLTNQNLEVVLGSYSFEPGTIYHIKAWTSNPNNGTDCDPHNDTVSVENVYSKLCGTYTIGGLNPNFETFKDAVSVINNAGIDCPVIFKVRDGTYHEQIEINTIPGSTDQNKIIFESESGDSSKVKLLYHETVFPNYLSPPTVAFNNAQNISIKKIGIRHESSKGTSYAAVSIKNHSRNIELSNCDISGSSCDWAFIAEDMLANISINKNFIHDIGNNMYLGNAENVQFSGNKIRRLGQVIIAGGTLNSCLITQNDIQHCSANGILFDFNGDSVFLTKNKIVGSVLQVNNNNSPGSCYIMDNQIISSSTSGIVVKTSNCLVSNNFINISGNNNGNGIDVNNCSQTTIASNSINILSNNVNNSKCLQINGGNTLLIKNNIFMNSGGGYCVFTNNPPLQSNWDYNNYFSLSNKIGFKNGTSYSNFSSWASAIGGEANGRNLNPYFANDSSYKTFQRGLNGAGIPIPGVLFDIEGKIRNDQAPDIGCWEFMVDFGITQVLHPTLACSHNPNDSLTIWIRQYGDIPFTNIKLAFRINNGPVHYDTIIGTIYNDIIYTFKQRINITNQGDYTIKCWLVDNVDDNVNNDTITVSRYSYPSPVVDFTHTYPCLGQPVQFNGTATIEPPYSIASYEWIFGDGDTAYMQNPVHIFQHPGNTIVTLMAYNNMGCYKDNSKTIVIQPSPDITISGPDTVCRGSSGLVYSTQTGKSNYNWSISPGGVITSGPGTSTITVSWNNHGDQWIRVNYQNAEGCQAAEPALFPVFINDIPAPTISGPATICDKTTPSAYTTEPGMSNYSWTISQGGTITGGAGTQSVTVAWSEAGDHSVSVTYQNAGGCVAQSPAILPVTVYGEVPPAGLITGDTLVCSGTPGHGYQIAPLPHATSYSWTIPLGATITGGAGTNHITVSFSNSTGVGHFAVFGKNLCFNGVPSPNLKVTVNAPPVGYQALKNLIIPAGNEECIAAQGITTAGGGTVFAVQPQAKVKLIASEYIHLYHGTSVQSGGYLKATVTDLCIPCNTLKALAENSWFGNDPSASLNITAEESILAYPNPTTGKFFIKIDPDIFSGDRTITIFNLTGEMILYESFPPDDETVYSLEQHSAGIYLVKISDGFTTRHTRIIKIE